MVPRWVKKPYFYIPVILLLLVGGVLGSFFIPTSQTPAFLHLDSGSVQVDLGSGYADATDGMELSETDKVRTGPDARATIVLYETVIITLKENTEVAISDLSKGQKTVSQTSGKVWSKIAHLGGVEHYSIQTPTTTATVRGTSFRNDKGDHYECIVADGNVSMQGNNTEIQLRSGEKVVGINGFYHKEDLSAEDIADIKQELRHELDVLRELRLREVYKNGGAISTGKKMYNITDDDIARFFIDIDEGRVSEDVIRERAPAITPSMKRVFAFDAEIKKTIELLKEY